MPAKNHYKLRCDLCKLPIVSTISHNGRREYIHNATIEEAIRRSLMLNLPVTHWIIREVVF